MATVYFDTYLIAEKLQKRGFSKEQTDGLMEVVRECDISRLVTTEALDNRLRETELRLKLHIGGMIVALGGILIAIRYFG